VNLQGIMLLGLDRGWQIVYGILAFGRRGCHGSLVFSTFTRGGAYTESKTVTW
jgi:hypothetical protein